MKVFASLAILFLAALPLLLPGTYFTYLAILVLIYSIVAIGLNLLSGYASQLSLGHAAFMAIGAYTSTLLSIRLGSISWIEHTGLHVWIGILAGSCFAALFGILLGVPVLKVRGPYLAMVTIAFGWIVWKVLVEWVPVTGGDLGISGVPKFQIAGFEAGTISTYYIIAAVFLLVFGLQHRLVTSPYGLLIRALRYDELAISAVGINVHRLKLEVLVLSSLIAGIGGALFAHQQAYINPDSFQFFGSVALLLAVLVGGPGTQFGPVVGTAILVVLPETLHEFDKYRLIVYGSLVLLTLYFLPRGVAGSIQPSLDPHREQADTQCPDDLQGPRLTDRSEGFALSVRNLSKRFGGIQALSSVDLDVKPSEIHALIGPNGAGKTTLINLVSGVDQPDLGVTKINGQVRAPRFLHESVRYGVARTFQTPKLLESLTVFQHLEMGLSISQGPSGKQALFSAIRHRKNRIVCTRGKAIRLLSQVGIQDVANLGVEELPHGHRKLVEIARALATDPDLLLLDEPAAGLESKEIANLRALLKEIASTGITIVLVEHNMDLVLAVSDRVTVLDQGSVIATGSPNHIGQNKRVISAYLGSDDDATSS